MRPFRFLTVGMVLLASALAVPSAQASGQPANDDIADATEITALPFSDSIDTAGATSELGEDDCAGATSTVWYSYDATADGTLTAYATSNTPLVAVAAYSSPAGQSLTPLSLSRERCWSDQEEFERSLSFSAEAGATYWIQVGTAEPGTVEFAFGGLGSVSGTVTDEEGAPLESICVLLASVRSSDSGIFLESGDWEVLTRPDGTYLLESRPGPVYVWFYDCTEEWLYADEFYDDAALISQATVVTIPPGGAVTGIDAALGPAPPLPVYEIGITEFEIDSVEDGPTTRPETVRVTFENQGPDEAGFVLFRIDACPASGQAHCNLLTFRPILDLPSGETHTYEIPWDGSGALGDMTVTARVLVDDADPSNDEATAETSVILPRNDRGIGVNVER